MSASPPGYQHNSHAGSGEGVSGYGPVLDSRRIVLSLLLVGGLVVAGATFGVLRVREDRAIARQFRGEAQERVRDIDRELGRTMGALRVVVAFFNASQLVEREEFHAFASPLLSGRAGIEHLGWAPRVAGDQREAHEREVRSAIAGYRITRRAADETFVPADAEATYFPLCYLEPPRSGSEWVGFDLASIGPVRAAIEHAESTGDREVICHAPVLGGNGDPGRVDVVAPVFGKGPKASGAAPRRSAGIVLLVLSIGEVVEHALSAASDTGIDFYLVDRRPEHGDRLFYAKRSKLGGQTPSAQQPEALARATLSHQEMFSLPESTAVIYALPTDGYLASRRTWYPSVAAVLCLVVAGLLMLAAGSLMGVPKRSGAR